MVVDVRGDKWGAPPALGLLLAVYRGYPEAVTPTWESPLTVELSFTRRPVGDDGKREAECSVAPLRKYAKSVVLSTERLEVTNQVVSYKFTMLM
jgi:hypothetical protein